MIYLDTSALIPLYAPEPLTTKAQRIAASRRPIALSDWTEVEFIGALAMKVRTGGLTPGQSSEVKRAFESHLTEGVFTRLAVGREHFRQAKLLIERSSPAIRSPDALHLAVAASHRLEIVTADKPMAAAATSLNIGCALIATDE